MARKSTAQLDLELPGEPEPEPDAPAPRRLRAKGENAPRRRRLRLILRWAGGAVVLAAVIVVPYQVDQFLASDPRFVLPAAAAGRPNFTVEGLLYTPAGEVTRVFARDFGRSVYLVPLGERRASLLRIDWVRDATVSRLWPNRIRVRIVERRPVAFLMLPAAGGSLEAALIDGDGAILRPPARARISLPVVHGITRRQPEAARRLRMRKITGLLAELASYASEISEIDINDTEDLIVTQMVETRAIRLRLGNRNYLAREQSFLRNYSDIGRRLPNARTFDLRLDNYFVAEDGATHAR